MSNIVVRARGLSKEYVMYENPRQRLRALIGIGSKQIARLPRHTAVDEIDLDIHAGERVAFIGRNGAGKSTLLKLITGVTQPSSGSLEVSGETYALLQMGAGFNGEATGRQNVISHLANLGIPQRETDAYLDEIIEFSELEEYIDQPFKVYSTGMQMRLIFAASTAIAPSLFVVDEVLGVGDAYFQQKSFSRIEQLCEENGTTLLLVSHDIYTASKMCSRVIWLERGRVQFDGDPVKALNLYEDSIRDQEEGRLRRKRLMPSSGEIRQGGPYGPSGSMLIEVLPESEYLISELRLRGVRASFDEGIFDQVLKHEAFSSESRNSTDFNCVSVVLDGSSWKFESPVKPSGGCQYWISHHGSIHNGGLLMVSQVSGRFPNAVELDFESDVSQTVRLLAHDAFGGSFDLGAWTIPETGHEGGVTLTVAPGEIGKFERYQASEGRRIGTGEIRLTGSYALDAKGASEELRQGEACAFVFNFHVNKVDPMAQFELLITIYRDGVQDVARAFFSSIQFPACAREGKLLFRIPRLSLTEGDYVASVLLAKAGYYASGATKQFTVNDQVVDVLNRRMLFSVKRGHAAYAGTHAEIFGHWQMDINQSSGSEEANSSEEQG